MSRGVAVFVFFSFFSVVFGNELTLAIVNNWQYLTSSEKLVYLLTDNDWNIYRQEFDLILSSTSASSVSQEESSSSHSTTTEKNKFITRELFIASHLEFQDLNLLEQFWRLCDRDQDQLLSLDEYVLCRGEVDCHGNPYERNEFDYLEEVLMKEFWEKISRSDYQPEVYRYDENGIIIDEEEGER
jgi:hypothetical protein